MARLRARTVFSDDTFTVTAIEKLAFRTDKFNRRCMLFGSLEPTAVIVTTPHKTYALDMDAQPVDLDQLELPAGLRPRD